jgi:hypothetical protein
MIFFYTGATYTARAEGATDVIVCCERCGEQYSYRLRRVAVARFHSPYHYHDPETGRKRAQKRANERLRRMLDSEAEVVPCPKCGWYQKEMIPLVRRSRLRRLLWVAVALAAAVLLAFPAGLVYLMTHRGSEEQVLPLWLGSMGLLPLCSLLCLVLRWLLNRLYDPNKAVGNQGGNDDTLAK